MPEGDVGDGLDPVDEPVDEGLAAGVALVAAGLGPEGDDAHLHPGPVRLNRYTTFMLDRLDNITDLHTTQLRPGTCLTMAGPPLSPKQDPWALAPLVHIMFSVMMPYSRWQSSLGRISTWTGCGV